MNQILFDGETFIPKTPENVKDIEVTDDKNISLRKQMR